jgi:proline dehydrogenase
MALMRQTLLWASTNPWIRGRAMKTDFVRRSVKRFMPGERVEDALAAAKELAPTRITTILTRLGENVERLDEATEVCDHYLRVLDLIEQAGLAAQISIKPTQLGFDQSPDACFEYCATLLDRCQARRNLLWLDMESSPYVDGTLALHRRLRARSDRVGVAFQACLYRSQKDVDELIDLDATVRLVKGAYLEPASVAYPRKKDVDRSYFELASRLLPGGERRGARLLHIATHDVPLQDRLRQIIAERAVPRDRHAFAMLYGIQSARQHQLSQEGAPTRCLISYGEHWFPWYMRRLAERPANVWFVARNMFRA